MPALCCCPFTYLSLALLGWIVSKLQDPSIDLLADSHLGWSSCWPAGISCIESRIIALQALPRLVPPQLPIATCHPRQKCPNPLDRDRDLLSRHNPNFIDGECSTRNKPQFDALQWHCQVRAGTGCERSSTSKQYHRHYVPFMGHLGLTVGSLASNTQSANRWPTTG